MTKLLSAVIIKNICIVVIINFNNIIILTIVRKTMISVTVLMKHTIRNLLTVITNSDYCKYTIIIVIRLNHNFFNQSNENYADTCNSRNH